MRTWRLGLSLSLLGSALGVVAQQGLSPWDPSRLTGVPAVDVLGAHDLWGNPTFVGGLTNSGPTARSVW